MVAPGLLGSGPLQLVIDMLRAAAGSISASDVLKALLTRAGEEETGFAADLFAAITTAAAATSGTCDGIDSGVGGLSSQVRAGETWSMDLLWWHISRNSLRHRLDSVFGNDVSLQAIVMLGHAL